MQGSAYNTRTELPLKSQNCEFQGFFLFTEQLLPDLEKLGTPI